MTINEELANDNNRRKAIELWRKVINDDMMSHHVTIEYRGEKTVVVFDNVEEQKNFIRELINY